MGEGQIDSSAWGQRIADQLADCCNFAGECARLYAYSGPLTQDKVQEMVAEIESIMHAADISKGKVKKTFTILIEGLQNMAIHSLNMDGNHMVGLAVHQVDASIQIHILGLAREENASKVKGLVANLNTMDRAQIKLHYLDVMENGTLSAKGGAGLGLITMVMKSDGGMQVEVIPETDEVCIISHSLKV